MGWTDDLRYKDYNNVVTLHIPPSSSSAEFDDRRTRNSVFIHKWIQ